MPLPKLSPLQSRLAASLIASIMVLILYLTFASPHFAYAADVDSTQPEDHNHNRLESGWLFAVDSEELDLREGEGYEGEFLGYDRGISGRAPTTDDPQVLLPNRPAQFNIIQGGTNSYIFLKESVLADPLPYTPLLPSSISGRGLEKSHAGSGSSDWIEGTEDLGLRRRQSSRTEGTVYISVNTCNQPRAIQNTTVNLPPQLRLYISLSDANTNPGPSKDMNSQQMHVLEGGATMVMVNSTGDIFMGLYGESTTDYTDVWNAEIAASVEGFYHTFYNSTDPNLFLVDSDSTSALFITGNLTNENSSSPIYQTLMDNPPSFTLFASNANDRRILGLQNSYCAWKQIAAIAPAANRSSDDVQMAITNRGNGQPRQQFFINGLIKGSSYNVVRAVAENRSDDGNVPGGGGQIFPMANFTTLSADNCAVIYNLSFCTETAYAVPGNVNNFPNASSLALFYDNSAQTQYGFFEKVLAQIPCETTSSAQYSLARNCDDCAKAYKEWLCSVTIPRCTDWNSTLPWLQNRNMIQPFPDGTFLDPTLVSSANKSAALSSSRNPNIDSIVQPGPYKEILPCDDLCYNIVQSCPASMGFGCPRPGTIAFNESYGLKSDGTPQQSNQVTCNYPGAAFDLLSVGSVGPRPQLSAFVTLAVMSLMFI